MKSRVKQAKNHLLSFYSLPGSYFIWKSVCKVLCKDATVPFFKGIKKKGKAERIHKIYGSIKSDELCSIAG